MDKVEATVTMTKQQAKEVKRFGEILREDYSNGYFDYDIKRCIRDYTSEYLFRTVMASAFGWFCSKNVPFACVYELVNAFVDEILKISRELNKRVY